MILAYGEQESDERCCGFQREEDRYPSKFRSVPRYQVNCFCDKILPFVPEAYRRDRRLRIDPAYRILQRFHQIKEQIIYFFLFFLFSGLYKVYEKLSPGGGVSFPLIFAGSYISSVVKQGFDLSAEFLIGCCGRVWILYLAILVAYLSRVSRSLIGERETFTQVGLNGDSWTSVTAPRIPFEFINALIKVSWF